MWVETRGKEAYGLSVRQRRHDFVRDPIEDASLFVGFGAFAAVGSILMAKRPRNPIGSGDHHDAAGQHCRLAKRRVMTRTSDDQTPLPQNRSFGSCGPWRPMSAVLRLQTP
jgi:hypothetical protein